jgi:transposase-like protein
MEATPVSARDVTGATRYHCPLCGETICYEYESDRRSLRTKMAETEAACRYHLSSRHRLRFWLWQRTGWQRALAA